MDLETCPSKNSDLPKDEHPRVSVVIENNVIKSDVENAVIPDIDFEGFFSNVWRKYVDRTALVDDRSRAECTFGELLDSCRRVAAGLRNLGLNMGDMVAFHAANSPELVIAISGTFFAGGIATLVRTSLTKGEIYRQLADAQPKFVFCGSEDINKFQDACTNIKSIQSFIVTTGSCEGFLCVSVLKQSALEDGIRPLGLNPDSVLVIPYSSGTTGLPKGAQLTHRNIIAQVISFG
ncbi:hypothetical protein MTO96_052175 [Rhipicephalus appendiculatus]